MRYKFRSILTALIAVCSVGSASGALLYYDSFNYPPGGANLSAAAPANWTHSNVSGTIEPRVENVGGLAYPNLQTSSDTFSVQYDGSGIAQNAGADVPSGVASHDISLTGINSGSLYYSLLLKVPTVQVPGGNAFASGTNLTFGSFMAGFQTNLATGAPGTGTTAAPLLIRTGDGTQFASTYQLGTGKTAANANRTFYTGDTYSTGANAETVFVVGKYTFDPTNPNNDIAQLFINPTPGVPEPAAQVTQTGGTNNLTLGTPPGIKSFFVRNNSVEPDVVLVDELRIGTTWEDVTPYVPEPATGALALFGLCLSLLLLPRHVRTA